MSSTTPAIVTTLAGPAPLAEPPAVNVAPTALPFGK